MDKRYALAIRRKQVLKFNYNGMPRVVEPQTYGLSSAGNEVLRAYQRARGSQSGKSQIAKLFDIEKISNLEIANQHFTEALPQHNPNDSAMIKIFATLPLVKKSERNK
jgi:hypothetical protein